MSDTSGSYGPNPYGFDLSRGVHMGSVEDLERFGDKFGKEMLDRVLRVNEGYAKLSQSCVSMQYRYARSSSAGSCGSSAASVGSSRMPGSAVGTPAAIGLMKVRADQIGRLKTWRQSVVPDGFCYSKVFKSGMSESRLVSIGAHPTLASLTRLSATGFKSLVGLESCRLVHRGAKSYHLTEGGTEGTLFLPAVKSYVSRVPVLPGSFGELVKQSTLGSSSVVFTGGSRIGANRDWKESKGEGASMVVFKTESESSVSAAVLAGRVQEFKTYAEYGPACYDSLVVEKSGLGYVSCSEGVPSTGDQVDMDIALSGKFVSQTTPWGQVKYVYSG